MYETGFVGERNEMSDKVLSTEKDKKKMSSNQPKWIKVRVPSTEILDKISIRIISIVVDYNS